MSVRVGKLQGFGRSLALFIGSLALLDVLRTDRLSEPLVAWWSSTYGISGVARELLLMVLAVGLVGYALLPRMGKLRRMGTQLLSMLLMVRCTFDAVQVLRIHLSASVPNARMVPLSVLLAVASAIMLWAVSTSAAPAGEVHASPSDAPLQALHSRWRGTGRQLVKRLPICAGAIVCAVVFAFCQMLFLGQSDYRRHADAVVVFGARVYRSGRPSLALADRVRTAAALVRNGYASVLIVSGGPGDGGTHEVEAMRDLAIAKGVRPSAILLDRAGLDTRATVDNSMRLLARDGREAKRPLRVLAVSHGYHLPRIKLSYQQRGVVAYTVPAKETRTLLRLPYYMARESVAFWAHAFQLS